MKYLVTGSEMQQYDANTTEYFHTPSLLLMECAAFSLSEEIKQSIQPSDSVLIVCGTGNNGADGLACARMLLLENYNVHVFLAGDEQKATLQFKTQEQIFKAYGFSFINSISADARFDLIVDAIFGVGLRREISGDFYQLIETLNSMSGQKLAVDMPSGVSADNGAVLGIAFRADITVTFAFEKAGMYLWPGNEYVGRIICRKIGITERSFFDRIPKIRALEPSDLDMLSKRPSHSNKGTFGRLLLIAGCKNMAGAAALSAKAAYAAGCGLVRIYTPEENRIILQTLVPEAVITTYSSSQDVCQTLPDAMKWADAIVCGPGLGTGICSSQIVDTVIHSADIPVVFDADALNLIAVKTDCLRMPHAEFIMTPHPGEMSRLTGRPICDFCNDLIRTASDFSEKYQVVCVLKDEHTVTALPDGKVYLNLSGNNGMATAGSGDVLSGITGSLLAQGESTEFSASMAVYLHGMAGDKMLCDTGYRGMTASDLMIGLNKIFAERKL